MKPNFKRIFFVFIFLTSGQNAFALTQAQEDVARRQNEQTQQRIERERRDLIKKRQKKEGQRVLESYHPDEVEEKKKRIFKESGGCIKIKEIKLSGNTSIDDKKLKEKFLSKYENSCITKVDIDDVQSSITNYYIKKGYTNSRVYLDFKSLKKKVLSIIIFEGRINEVLLLNNSRVDRKLPFRKKIKSFVAFGNKEGKVFNLRDFEQGIDQMNRLRSSEATIKSVPSNKSGYSDIVVENKIENPLYLSASYDNSGQESTGKRKRKLNLSYDNLFGLYDNLYLNHTKDNEPFNHRKFSKSSYFSYTIPFGYYKLNTSYSKSDYLVTVNSLGASYRSSGVTRQKNFTIDRVLKRTQNSKLLFETGLSLRDTQSFINDAKSDVGSRKTSSLLNALVFNYRHQFDSVTYRTPPVSGTYVSLSHTRGMDWFDSKSDKASISSEEAHAQFDKINLHAAHSTPFFGNFMHKIGFDGQYSTKTLFGSRKFYLGGQSSVRGYNENSISGDLGYNLRNDIEASFFRGKYGGNILTSVFFDYGYARNKKIVSQVGEGTMSGYGARLRYHGGKYLNWDLVFSRGLHSPKFIQNIYNQEKEKETIYFSVSAGFGLF